ncbi:PREDICTED: tetraspanin-8-like [Nicotiana attenuata]|uniref:Tetraspanin-8 n=1 Tax=Nicotiana attenuata TaxID=49451 RepID=A0A1J6IJ32_NICAT|nr:PREDICTED: tetraspanin-8-like [Nicotiana attenuata]OIT04316.1 tetraspanin-8 [Nicotiana attenuata]
MVRVSNFLISFVNLLTFVVAILAIAIGIWAKAEESKSLCQKAIYMPFLIFGASLLVLSLMGLVGSCCRASFFLWIYLFFLFLFIVGMICFSVFTILVTNKNVGKALSGKGDNEAKFGDWQHWLEKHVVNEKHWGDIKSCMATFKYCQMIPRGKSADFYKYSLPVTQSSCCKPPTYCGFEFHNATHWTMPKAGPAVPDSDCKTWSNVQNELCFNCQSCKSSFLESIQKNWNKFALINFCIFVFIIIIYSVGCCALRNNRSKGYYKPYP